MPRTEPGSSEDLLAELSTWVALETPTTDAEAVNRLMDVAAGELDRAGAALTRVPGHGGYGDTLLARTPGSGKPVVVIGHLDTVWSTGTLAAMPYRVDGDRAHGPGIFDMKAGSFIAFHAVRSILQQGVATKRPIVLMLTPDEEVGSPTSRAIIEREGREAAAVLIVEPAGKGGACVTARKGVGRFTLRVEGIGSHAGGAFEDGASAVVELARQVLAIHGMVDLDRGITLNAAPIHGGTRPNVIPAEAGCEIDLRVPTAAEGTRMVAALLRAEGGRSALHGERGGRHEPAALRRVPRHHRALREGPRARGKPRHDVAEAASRRRIGRQFHRGTRHPDARRARLPRRRRACQP